MATLCPKLKLDEADRGKYLKEIKSQCIENECNSEWKRPLMEQRKRLNKQRKQDANSTKLSKRRTTTSWARASFCFTVDSRFFMNHFTHNYLLHSTRKLHTFPFIFQQNIVYFSVTLRRDKMVQNFCSEFCSFSLCPVSTALPLHLPAPVWNDVFALPA